MKRNPIPLLFFALSFFQTSCGLWNPDPAERLAYSIERNAKDLRESDHTTATFAFVPDANTATTFPRLNGDIVVRVVPDRSINADDGSTILVSEWFWTTYHSRFVRVTNTMEARKKPDEPFWISLKKSGDSIYWIGLQ